MRRCLFTFLLICAATTFAQTQPSVPGATPTAPTVIAGAECPVGMTVEQQGWGRVEWTISLEDKGKPEVAGRPGNAGVRVKLKASKDRGMSQVELAVYYIAPGARVLPVPETGSASKPASELKKTFVLSAGDSSAPELGGSLLVGDTAGITRVQLMRVTYSDGGLWKTSGSGCSVKPSLFIPVQPR
jgi:hypothetical protein